MEKILIKEDLKKVDLLLEKYDALAETGNVKECQNLAIEALSLLDISREKFGDDRRIWTTIGDIYRAGLPFLGCDVIAMALIIAFPAIALWLPAVMR